MDKPQEDFLSCRGKGPYTEIGSIYLTEFSETFRWRRFLEVRVHHASSDDGNENDRVFLLFPLFLFFLHVAGVAQSSLNEVIEFLLLPES